MVKWFRVRRGLLKMLLHGEGVEDNKNDPKLLTTLEKLYGIIVQYDPKNVYSMDETGLFSRLLPKYLRQMTIHDMFN